MRKKIYKKARTVCGKMRGSILVVAILYVSAIIAGYLAFFPLFPCYMPRAIAFSCSLVIGLLLFPWAAMKSPRARRFLERVLKIT